MPEAEFLFQLLVIALDPPTQFREIDQAIEGHVRGEGGQPVFGGLGLTLGPGTAARLGVRVQEGTFRLVDR